MICPNCKTELVEVNGRYICSDCGREIPENEVMASDWGNGGAVRAGLFGAGTDEPEEGSAPVAEEYNTSLSESESEDAIASPTVVEPATPESPEELTVEEVLQQQTADSMPIDQPASEPAPETGFYTAGSSQPAEQPIGEPEVPPVISAPVLEVAEPVAIEAAASETPVTIPVESVPVEQAVPVTAAEPEIKTSVSLPEVDPVEPVAEEIPITVPPVDTVAPANPTPSFVIPAEAGIQAPEVSPEVVPEPTPAPETIPEHSEVVKDMFADTAIATAPVNPDPGIYTDPLYDTNQVATPLDVPASGNLPMPADKRMNLIIIIVGTVLTIMLIVGGIWGYVALNKKTSVVEPVVTNQEVVWQEFQVVDGGFKISFPGAPEKSEATQSINGADTILTNYAYATDDITYSVGFAKLDAAKTKVITDSLTTTLPALVKEVATAKNLTVSESKIGKYYTADAIDFTLTSDTASYQGKLLINGGKYILVMAGSSSGQTVDYSKFIKSFSFITTGSTN